MLEDRAQAASPGGPRAPRVGGRQHHPDRPARVRRAIATAMPVRAPKSDQPHEPEGVPAPDAPKLDTSTDWDEWMERHGGRPASRPDVADAEGRFPTPPEETPERK